MNGKNISKYLSCQADKKRLLLVSFFITNPVVLVQLKKEWAQRRANGGKAVKSAVDPNDFGGSIALADPYNLEKGFLIEMDVPFAFGLCFNDQDRSLYVAGGTVIRKIKGGHCLKYLSNNLFNDLHSLAATTSGNLLVVATGTDSVIEVGFDNTEKTLWDWIAHEHGYSVSPDGKVRSINRKERYCQLIATPTPEQTTHVNTAFEYKPDRILATLFHQGELVEIDKQSKETKVLLSGLTSPHNIHRRKGGFILSDSRANKVLILDDNFCIEGEIKRDFDWVQDAWDFEEGLSYLLADSNNDRLILVEQSGKLLTSLQWPESSKKISAMEFITVAQAKDIFIVD